MIEQLTKYYQVDEDNAFQFEAEYFSQPHGGVMTAPPDNIPDGSIAIWQTVLDKILSNTWGRPGTGSWAVLEDHRNEELYKKLDGEKFIFDKATYNGLGPIPEHLTTLPRPTPDHIWRNDSWWIDPAVEQAAQEAKLKAELDARIQAETQRANQVITPLQDAVELDIATEQEQETYTAWRRYRVLLSRIHDQAGYPINVDFPGAPDHA